MARSLLFLGLVFAAAGCMHNKPAATAEASAPVNTMCAVNSNDKADPALYLMQDGKKVAFCCKDCQSDFQKDPKKYMMNLK